MSLEFQIINVLKTLVDPLTQKDIFERGILQGLTVTASGKVSFTLEINTEYMNEGIKLKEKAQSLIKNIPGVSSVYIVLTAQRHAKVPPLARNKISGVRHVIAVGSGKGGVGKSTTAVNLASALQQMNLKIGILDGDIYGPSLPRRLGIDQKPISEDGKTIIPIEVHGLKCMSIGFMVAESVPTIWRGPMAQNAFRQMLHQVQWGELDVLVIDLPPGTGDIHLTLTQSVLVSGAIIVSTPQDLALVDARKGLEMFRKVSVPILGFVENMSYFICPHCNERSEIFEHGGVHKTAQALDVPLLVEIPLHMAIREASEKGRPIPLLDSASLESRCYQKLAKTVWKNLNKSF